MPWCNNATLGKKKTINDLSSLWPSFQSCGSCPESPLCLGHDIHPGGSFHCIAATCNAVRWSVFHLVSVHCISLHCISLHHISLHCISLYCILLHCKSLHCRKEKGPVAKTIFTWTNFQHHLLLWLSAAPIQLKFLCSALPKKNTFVVIICGPLWLTFLFPQVFNILDYIFVIYIGNISGLAIEISLWNISAIYRDKLHSLGRLIFEGVQH